MSMGEQAPEYNKVISFDFSTRRKTAEEVFEKPGNRLPPTGEPPTSPPMDDAWKKSVDDQLKRATDNIRTIVQVGFTTAIVIAGMIIGLYVFVGTKVESVKTDVADLRLEVVQHRADARVVAAETKGQLNQANAQLADIKERLPK